MSEMAFEIHAASYTYPGNVAALDRVELSVRKGERLAILGANGSGKSTLLKLMDGLYFPTSGQVCFGGLPLTEESFRDNAFNFDFRRKVGFVFQDSDVQLFCSSVWDEIAFAPLQLGLDQEEVRQRVETALAALRIEKVADRPPHRLSGGEKKRVALATVLSLDPQVWLMDEPSAGLDPRSQSWLEDFIFDQGSLGRTIVTATHDLSLMEAFADRVVVFDEEHRLVAEGKPAEILADTHLLVQCNLIHQHRHVHPETHEEHSHPHQHGLGHDHAHPLR